MTPSAPAAGARRTVLRVSEAVAAARALLETTYASVWIRGEVSNLKRHSSGHFYFTLKDDAAQLRCAMFKASNRRLKFRLEDGLEIIAGGRLSIYTARGDFQMVVEVLEPAGLGALQLAVEQLKRRLAAEGLFDPARKRPLPDFPRRIAVVTSPTGAAIRDILNVTGRRNALADLAVYPVRVQGEGAAAEIARALTRLNDVGGWDVIICGRGGGSLEDLWAFNEEAVVRAIAASRIPVISAVGHEIDTTLADLAADVRAETPTAAAEMVLRDRRELSARTAHLAHLLVGAVSDRLRAWNQRVENLARHPVLQRPRRVLEPLAQRVDELALHLQGRTRQVVRLAEARLRAAAGSLEALSPLQVMARGYALVTRGPAGTVVRTSEGLRSGDVLRIRFHRGGADCRVETVTPREHGGATRRGGKAVRT